MQILLSCAKDMTDTAAATDLSTTQPIFQREAEQTAVQLTRYSADELAEMLHVNPQLAALNKLRYAHFLDPKPTLQAAWAYHGIVFKKLDAASMSAHQLQYANQHLWITSFLYGLLRPLNGIKGYRLEGNVRLPEYDDQTMFDFWKPRLTDVLIQSILDDDGILLNLASGEMKNLFDWKRIRKAVRIIEPAFKVRKGDKLRTIVVYAKMCRGAMARHVIVKQTHNPNALKAFEYEGFAYDEQESKGDLWMFTML